MPYSPPGVVAPSLPAPAPSTNAHTRPPPRPGHRRSYTFAVDDPRAGPGAFSSLGALPRRTHSHSHAGIPTTQRKFHFGGGENDDSSSSSDEKEANAQLHPVHPAHQPYLQSQHTRQPARVEVDDDDGPPPPLRLRTQGQAPTFRLTPMTGHRSSPPRSPQRSPRGSPNSSFTNVPSALSVNTLNVPVPFPRSATSSLSPLSPVPATGTYPTRPPGPSRTASTPIILSNGKPLKSSLKSSKSAPHVPSPGANGTLAALGPSGFHLRAQSAPSSPSLGAGVGVAGNWIGSEPSPPMTPKAVHFPAPDAGLEDIRLFKRSARPASVSFPLSLEDETETETETDRDAPRIAVWGGAGERGAGGEWVGDRHEKASGFPFPRIAPRRSPLRSQTNEKEEKRWKYELHAPGVPRKREEHGAGDMVRVEKVWVEDSFSSSSSTSNAQTSPSPEVTLHGTLLARNAAFEKHLFVRFTLDGWATTSEVGARYVDSVNGEEEAGPGWDRFGFSIRLTDYAHSFAGQRTAGSLRGMGGGLGKGLEGRTLVLVARFFAPWVREGGVGPYVWCDTLPPNAQTPATQAGVGTSPSGRPWIGTGGGGPGEWWDNNGGKNYEVGFRCVDVEEPAPAPAPASPPAQIPAPQQNVIPFPTSSTADTDAPPSPSTQPEAPASASPLPTSTPTHPAGAPPAPTENKPIPPPPPPRTAHAQALAAKLGRLSLRNYAAPVRPTAVPGLVTPPVAMVSSSTATASGEQQKTAGEEKKTTEHTPGTQSTAAVGLYWPWGRSSLAPASPPPAPAPQTKEEDSSSYSSASDASDDEEDARRDVEAGLARRRGRRTSDETPPTSPLGAGGLLPVIEGLMSTMGMGEKMGMGMGMDEKVGMERVGADSPTPTQEKEAKDVPLPTSPPLASPPSSNSSPTPTPSASPPSPPMSPTGLSPTSPSSNSSLLYKAFVRQWCFAGAGNGNGPSAGMPSPLAAGR